MANKSSNVFYEDDEPDRHKWYCYSCNEHVPDEHIRHVFDAGGKMGACKLKVEPPPAAPQDQESQPIPNVEWLLMVTSMNDTVQLEDLVDIPEAARLLHCSPWTIRAWIRDGKLRRLKAGSRVLLSRKDLAAFVRDTSDHAGPIDMATQKAKRGVA